MEEKMFCFQCQETARGVACTMSGVCGKKPDVAAMQDLLIYATKGLSAVTTQLRKEGKTVDKDVNHQVTGRGTVQRLLFAGTHCVEAQRGIRFRRYQRTAACVQHRVV